MEQKLKNKIESKLIVSEVFYSIQGEGKSMGIPSVFLRLAGCNLLCEGIGWRCDTIEVWRKGTAKEFNQVFTEEQVERLREGAHLIITGGEPLLHQLALIKFLKWFVNTHNFKPFIEVETNGTIAPLTDLYINIDQWNVSPKLSTSGEKAEKRINEQALNFFKDSGQVYFKFVISSESDIEEILQDFEMCLNKNTYLMPAGDTQEKLNAIRLMVVNLCIKMGLRYSERLHIVIWNQKTGV